MNEIEKGPWADEARARWGETDAYKESARRTKAYSADDWKLIEAEVEEVEQRFAAALAAGAPTDGERAMDLAEEARLHIDRRFYPCSRAMHAKLAQMYVADERFKAHYEERAEGLAAYVSAAIQANLDREADAEGE